MNLKYSRKILKELYELGDTEIKCFVKVYREKEVTISKVSRYLKKDITHTARCLKKLHDLGLIDREARKNPKNNSRFWIYKPLAKTKIKKILRERAKEVFNKTLKNIRKL